MRRSKRKTFGGELGPYAPPELRGKQKVRSYVKKDGKVVDSYERVPPNPKKHRYGPYGK